MLVDNLFNDLRFIKPEIQCIENLKVKTSVL